MLAINEKCGFMIRCLTLKLLLFEATPPPLLVFSCGWLLFELVEVDEEDGAGFGRFGRISILIGIEFVVVAVAAGAECNRVSFGGGSR